MSILLIIDTYGLNACHQVGQNDAAGNAVDTANTSTKTQGQVNLCWAYSAVAMIESRYKIKTGVEIDLSEEAIGFFHLAEQIKETMDKNLSTGKITRKFDVIYAESGYMTGGRQAAAGSRGALELIERWGLVPESLWKIKFDEYSHVESYQKSINSEFIQLQNDLLGKQSVVQYNQVFSMLTRDAFPSVPPVDGFDNGSGYMNSVQYAKDVIGFKASDYESVSFMKANGSEMLHSLERVKRSLANGLAVGIGISMPSNDEPVSRISGTRFLGIGSTYLIEGGHAMVITDFRNSGGSFGKSADVESEVAKPIDSGFQLRLKNSWGSQSGYNEFGEKVSTGYYDMDVGYIYDTLASGGFVAFTFAK